MSVVLSHQVEAPVSAFWIRSRRPRRPAARGEFCGCGLRKRGKPAVRAAALLRDSMASRPSSLSSFVPAVRVFGEMLSRSAAAYRTAMLPRDSEQEREAAAFLTADEITVPNASTSMRSEDSAMNERVDQVAVLRRRLDTTTVTRSPSTAVVFHRAAGEITCSAAR